MLPVNMFLLKSYRILLLILKVKLRAYKALSSLDPASSLTSSWAVFLLAHQTWTPLAIKWIKLFSALEHPCCWCCRLQCLFPGLLFFKFQVTFHFLLRFFLVIQSKPHPQSFYSIACYISFAAFIYCLKLFYLIACSHSTATWSTWEPSPCLCCSLQ